MDCLPHFFTISYALVVCKQTDQVIDYFALACSMQTKEDFIDTKKIADVHSLSPSLSAPWAHKSPPL